MRCNVPSATIELTWPADEKKINKDMPITICGTISGELMRVAMPSLPLKRYRTSATAHSNPSRSDKSVEAIARNTLNCRLRRKRSRWNTLEYQVNEKPLGGNDTSGAGLNEAPITMSSGNTM